MSIIIQKFGGTSVADSERLRRAAKIITDAYSAGSSVVAVVSAQGDTTDDLIAKAAEISNAPPKREMDVLLSTGEQISISLLAMAIEKAGFPAVSLTGWQAGFQTDSAHCSSCIKRIDTARLEKELAQNRIVIVAGFQGIDDRGDITTLGRGGSDTSAVALAAALGAEVCMIYTDVDGVYTADPRIVKNAKKLDEISYDEMLELARLGANVLHSRSVETAKKYNVKLGVLSSFEDRPGTVLKNPAEQKSPAVCGVACNKAEGTVSAVGAGIGNLPALREEFSAALEEAGINILSAAASEISISFSVELDQCEEALRVLHSAAGL